jgi:hypothetical protein
MCRNCGINGTRTSFEKGADNSQKVAWHEELGGRYTGMEATIDD